MGTVISDVDTSKFNPTAQLKVEGAMIKGTLLKKDNVKTKWGSKPKYVVAVLDASCKFFKGKTEEVFPEAGAEVDVFTTTRLERQLSQVPMKSNVEIKCLGKKDVGGPNDAWMFHVEII